MNIGKNIRACREFKKISRNELASMLDVNVSSISRYELGTREPNMATIQSISNALDVEIDALLNGFSKDIYTKEDVFSLYHKLNTRTKLSKFLGFTDDYDMGFMALKEGAGSLDLYFKLGGYLNLADNQIYNWILSDCITCLIGYDDFKVSNVSYDDIKYIIDNNILKKQSIDSLINKGLSEENKTLLKNYFASRSNFLIKTLKEKYSLKEKCFDDNKNDLKQDIANQINEIHDFLRRLDKHENHKLFSDSIKKVSLLTPILESLGVNIKSPYVNEEDDDVYVTVEIKDKDFYHDFCLDDFIDFVDKIFWGIERELDYLIHLYDK